MSANPTDLFYEYNKRLSEEIRRRQVKDVVVIGPPKSGKTFFKTHYLSDLNVIEETVGILSVEIDAPNLKDRLKEFIAELGNKVKNLFSGASEDLASSGVIDVGDASGIKLPKEYVEHLKKWKSQGKLIVFYSIPLTEAKELASVLEQEKVRFAWLGKEYAPPGLLRLEEKRLREQLRLYKRLNELFGIKVEEGIDFSSLAGTFTRALADRAPEILTFIAGRFVKLLPPISLVLEVLITALILEVLDDKNELWKTLFEAIESWSKLNEELRQLTAANLAFATRLNPEVVYKGMERLSNEDVRKELEKLMKYVKEEVEKVERKGDLSDFGIVYPRVNGDDLIGLGVYNGKVYEGGNKYHQLVTTRFDDVAKEVKERLLKERIVVVRGPKGVGKSTLTHYVISQLLQSGEFTWAVKVVSNINPADFNVQGDKVVFFYDFYPYEEYTSLAQSGRKLNAEDLPYIIGNMKKIINEFENAYAIIVLSDDILAEYRPVSELIKGIQEVKVDLRLEDFIEGVVKSYSGCSNVSEVAKAILDNYEGGYTLLAKYAGLSLKRNNCNYKDVKKVLEDSRNDPVKFLKKYVDAFLDQTHIERYALPLLIHVFLGEVPVRVAKELPSWINDEKDYDYNYEGIVAPWIATRKEDLVEEALREYLKDLIEGKNLVEYLRGFEKHDILKRYLSENKELKEIIERVKKSIEVYLAELKDGGLSDDDLNAVKASMSYDEGLWGRATQDFYEVLKGWASSGGRASDKDETAIIIILLAVIREFLRGKLLEENDGTSLKLLLRIAFRTTIQTSAKDLFDEADEELKEYLFTEDHEVPPSIRFAVHGFPPFINGLFNGYNSGKKCVKTVDGSLCEYLKQADESEEVEIDEVAAGAALYLLSIPEKLSDECWEKIIENINNIRHENNDSIYLISYMFLRFLVKKNSLHNRPVYKLSIVLTNIPMVHDLPDLLRAILDAGYMLRDRIEDETVRKIYTINVIRGLIGLGLQIDESVIKEAKSLMSLEDEELLYYQATLAEALMEFYINNGLWSNADKLAERLERVWESLENVNWGEVTNQLNKKGIEENKDRLKEKTKKFVSHILARYYHERFDIEKEKKYVDAEYDAIIKRYGGEEKAKENHPNDYFLALLERDVINAVLGEDLGEALDEVVKHSEDAFEYSPQIGTGTVKIIIKEYLLASAYLGRLGEALKVVNDDPDLIRPFLSMSSRFLLGLYSLFHYLTGGKFLDKVREYAKEVINDEVLLSITLTLAYGILKNIGEKPMCRRALIEMYRGLLRELGLNESEASYLIYRFLKTKPGIIFFLTMGRLFSGLEVVKELAMCFAEYERGAVAELLRKVSEAGNEEEFKDALVRLAMFLNL